METFPSSALARESLPISNPSAGSEWTAAVAGQGWLLKAVSGQIVQGITQTPTPILQVLDAAGDVLFESLGASGAQSASTTARYTWAPGLTLSALVGTTPNIHAVAPLPHECFLAPGWTVQSKTLGIGAGTQWTGVTLWIIQSG